MAKRETMSHRSLSQLRQQVWRSHKEAVAELKRNAFPAKGEDYEIRESEPGSGSWMIFDRSDDVSQQAEERPEPVKKKAAAKKQAAAEPEPAEPAPEPAAANDAADWRQPLPYDGKPYRIVLREGVGYPAHGTHSWAIEISQWRRAPVDVVDKDGAVVRTVDARQIKPERKLRAAPSPANRSAEMADWSKRALELAQSPAGAKRAELNKLREGIGWKAYLERLGKRFGLTLHPDRDADGIVYRLKKPD